MGVTSKKILTALEKRGNLSRNILVWSILIVFGFFFSQSAQILTWAVGEPFGIPLVVGNRDTVASKIFSELLFQNHFFHLFNILIFLSLVLFIADAGLPFCSLKRPFRLRMLRLKVFDNRYLVPKIYPFLFWLVCYLAGTVIVFIKVMEKGINPFFGIMVFNFISLSIFMMLVNFLLATNFWGTYRMRSRLIVSRNMSEIEKLREDIVKSIKTLIRSTLAVFTGGLLVFWNISGSPFSFVQFYYGDQEKMKIAVLLLTIAGYLICILASLAMLIVPLFMIYQRLDATLYDSIFRQRELF